VQFLLRRKLRRTSPFSQVFFNLATRLVLFSRWHQFHHIADQFDQFGTLFLVV